MEYQDLQDLLHHNSEAQACFDALPDYAREQISQHRQQVRTLYGLKEYARNLTRRER